MKLLVKTTEDIIMKNKKITEESIDQKFEYETEYINFDNDDLQAIKPYVLKDVDDQNNAYKGLYLNKFRIDSNLFSQNTGLNKIKTSIAAAKEEYKKQQEEKVLK